MFRKSTTNAPKQPQRRLGELLLAEDIITKEQLMHALKLQQSAGGFLGQILVEEKIISQDTLISYLAKQCHIPHLSLLNYKISSDALSQVPKELCLKHYLIPVDKMGRILTLAMVDPLDTQALEEIKKHCPGLRIKPVLCTWEHYQVTVKQLYAQEVKKPDNLQDKYAQFGLRPPTTDHTPAERDAGMPSQKEIPPEDIDKTMVMDAPSAGSGSQTRAASAEPDTGATQATAAGIQEMAEAMRDGVTAAVEASGREDKPQSADMASIASETLESIAKSGSSQEKGLAAIAQAMLDSLDANKQSQAEKEDHLAKIAQAALESVRQTAQFIEMHAVAQNNRADMQPGKAARHTSVAPFLPDGKNAPPADAPEYEAEDDKIRAALQSNHPLETLTFDNFFAGETNKFTVKLARAVAEKPGGEYNPLFIYGKVGLGKTHLISAIGNLTIAHSSNDDNGLPRRIGYISASHFARRLAVAIADNALESFRDHYCHWDMLILDDIQFLGGRVDAQEEFFHIFNVLQQQGRQIVIAGDKAPDRLGMLEQRLVSRFASGIVAELKPPEWETRIKILRYYMEQEQTELPEEVLSLVAMRVSDDVRKMTGAFRKIVAYGRLENGKITIEDAQNILSHLGVHEAA